jgi:glucose-1-phosphate cytidylyltransferase
MVLAANSKGDGMMHDIPVVILAGGRGTRLGELTGITPKPMVKIGDEPILWHIMKWFMKGGFREFYILTGYLHDDIERYFLHKGYSGSSKLSISDLEIKGERSGRLGCTVHLIDTGEKTGIAARVKKVEKDLGNRRFILTYGDGLADIDLAGLVSSHESSRAKSKTVVTISVVQPRSKFGVVDIEDGGRVSRFREKPMVNEWINIGYMVVEPELFAYLSDVKEGDMLERDIYPKITSEGKISAYRHPGEFRAMDSYGDFVELNSLWSAGKAFWKA